VSGVARYVVATPPFRTLYAVNGSNHAEPRFQPWLEDIEALVPQNAVSEIDVLTSFEPEAHDDAGHNTLLRVNTRVPLGPHDRAEDVWGNHILLNPGSATIASARVSRRPKCACGRPRHCAALRAPHASLAARRAQIGMTPLWWAAEKGHLGVVQLLVERGADFETKNTVRRAASAAPCTPVARTRCFCRRLGAAVAAWRR
jgi:hypothetical protein